VQKTAEPIQMPFRMLTHVGSRSHVLDGGRNPRREGALLRGYVPAHCNVATREILYYFAEQYANLVVCRVLDLPAVASWNDRYNIKVTKKNRHHATRTVCVRYVYVVSK